MKTLFSYLSTLLLVCLLAGCNQVLQYNISEQEINQTLAKHNNFEKQIGLSGLLNANIKLHDLSSQIGREEPNTVILTGIANVDISSLIGSQKAEMHLKMKARPVFDPQKGEIFLKDMVIEDVSVQPEKMQSALQTLTPYLNESLKNYFDQKPAWVLSSDRSKAEALAKRFAKGLEVKPGELVIPFTD